MPTDYKKQVVSSFNSFNQSLKEFEASINLSVPNAINKVSNATLSGIDNINDRLKAIEATVNDTMDNQVNNRKAAYEELKRQFGALTLFPSKKPGKIDTGPNLITDTQFDTDAYILSLFTPERNKVRKDALMKLISSDNQEPTTSATPDVAAGAREGIFLKALQEDNLSFKSEFEASKWLKSNFPNSKLDEEQVNGVVRKLFIRFGEK